MKISRKLVEKENLPKLSPTFKKTALMVASTTAFSLNQGTGVMV